MTIKKVEGIVVREIDYSNSSKIITVLTKDYGLINFLAKGAKQIKSKLRTTTTTFSYGFFHIYYKENHLSTLISVDLINYFNNLRNDITNFSYAAYLTDIVMQVSKQDFSVKLFDLYIASLIKINEGFNPKAIASIYELQILNFLGIAPVLTECVSCGSSKITDFSVEAGGAVCLECNSSELNISQKALKLLSLLSYVDINKISKLDIKEAVINELNNYIDDYFEKYSGLYLKSKKSLKTLTSLE